MALPPQAERTQVLAVEVRASLRHRGAVAGAELGHVPLWGGVCGLDHCHAGAALGRCQGLERAGVHLMGDRLTLRVGAQVLADDQHGPPLRVRLAQPDMIMQAGLSPERRRRRWVHWQECGGRGRNRAIGRFRRFGKQAPP